MTLTLRITSYRGAPPAGAPSVTFDERGGSIGRAQDNDWVLPDPDRFISSRHAAIAYRDTRYYITDVSLNGVLVNGHKLGQGNSTVLSDGDTLGFGEYEVRVEVAMTGREPPPLRPPGAEPPAFLPEGALGMEPVLPELEAGPGPPLRPPEALARTTAGEPFTTPFRGVPGESPAEPIGPPMRDDLARIHEPFAPPKASPEIPAEIPDRWWEESGQPAPTEPAMPRPPFPPLAERLPEKPAETAAVPPARPAEPPRRPLPATERVALPEAPPPLAEVPPPAGQPPETPQRPTPSPGATRTEGESAGAFLRGLGLDPSAIPGLVDRDEALARAGQLLRVLVGGLRELLAARASIKQEARLQITTLRPVENNPLKFTVTTDDALRHLLQREPAPGFLGPIEAVEEVMQDLKAHQLATLAGLEATLKGMFQRFDPARLEREFTDRSLLSALVPGHRKGRCWDLFSAEFRRIAQEAEEDFQALFGREFARAYEEQVRRLRAAREGRGGLGRPPHRDTPS